MGTTLTSERLTLRSWTLDDVDAALAIYGHEDVARWLSPAMDTVGDRDAMRLLLQQWIAEDFRATPPTGRWAVELTAERRVIGGVVVLPMPPEGEDLEFGWQLVPEAWGHGYAAEAGNAIAHWALSQPEVDELFAVVRPNNTRGEATAKRIGMEWVGETDKYYGMRLQVYRLRAGDLDHPLPGQTTATDTSPD
ncbi:GNAT family N-acetyltransferase [Streptomyces sp. JJ38]|uniref:GNAT family N-acetyltransferase n=1 Tax=Streptomyces sp. JJ38 TaxID=2738128 RepID=UPI001C56CD67|nr:GNAT family N-acetyltransferase [Streptomyces sp. JJ38]MBW1597883.1 GNAT family N-acetyltransferase [Streptomyces sp. JJ38]